MIKIESAIKKFRCELKNLVWKKKWSRESEGQNWCPLKCGKENIVVYECTGIRKAGKMQKIIVPAFVCFIWGHVTGFICLFF